MGFYVPNTLKRLNNWALWKLDGKQKIPYSAKFNGRASVNKLHHWTSYGAAVEKLEYTDDYNGLGFLFSQNTGLVFIDLDNCINEETEELTPFANNIVNAFAGTYIEYSQSGRGLHIICKGTIPANFPRKKDGQAIEIYGFSHYMAFTGNAYEATEPTNKQKELNKLCDFFNITKKEPQPANNHETTSKEPDEKILERCEKWQDFKKLFYKGVHDFKKADGEPDNSRADYRLAFILFNCCNGNREQAERLFLNSELAKREKCKRSDYIKRTFDGITKIPYKANTRQREAHEHNITDQPTPKKWRRF